MTAAPNAPGVNAARRRCTTGHRTTATDQTSRAPGALRACDDGRASPLVTSWLNEQETCVVLEPWKRPRTADDPDANVNADVAVHARVDALATVRSDGPTIERPVDPSATRCSRNGPASVHDGLLAGRPSMTRQLADACDHGQAQGTDSARLAAASPGRGRKSWLWLPARRPALCSRSGIDGGSW